MADGKTLPNPMILFNNHFTMHRREYAYATRLAIATDLGYEGYEFHAIEPDDDATWHAAREAFRQSGLRYTGMYVVMKGVTDDEVSLIPKQLERVERILDRLVALPTSGEKPYLNLSISSNPSRGSRVIHESGSASAEERHWQRAAELVAEVDRMLIERGMSGNIYNHSWFMTDTPQAGLRVIKDAKAKAIGPGIATKHAHLHQGVPNPPQLLGLPGMEKLAYVALLNVWPEPGPFRTMPIDAGQIDIAGFLAYLWKHGYSGPLIMQAYDQGGDPYVTARACINYVREVWDRFQTKPHLNPALATGK